MLSAVEKLIIGFVGLIIGLALIPQIAITTNSVTGLTATTDTVNIAGARLAGGALNESYTFTLVHKCLYSRRSTSEDSPRLSDEEPAHMRYTSGSFDKASNTTLLFFPG